MRNCAITCQVNVALAPTAPENDRIPQRVRLRRVPVLRDGASSRRLHGSEGDGMQMEPERVGRVAG